MHTAIAKLKRGLAMLLSMIMLMSALPASAFADDDAAPAETTAAAVEEAPVVSSTADEGAQSDETADPALPTSVTAAEETTGAESAPAPETSSAQDQNAASESGSAPEENAASEAAPVQLQESAPAPAPAPVDRELTVGKTVDEKLTAEKDSFTIRLTVERYSRLLLKLSGAVRVTMFNEQESEKKEAVYTVSKDATGEWAAFEQILSVPEATYFITVTALEKPQTDIGCPFTLVFENYIVPAAAPAPGAEQTETPAAAPALSAEQEESPAAAEPSAEPVAEPSAEPASEPAPIEYSFSGENDSVMLLTLLTEHGVYTTALDDAEVTAGNEQAVELLSLIGDYIAVPAEHFNKLTLTVTTREGDRIEIFLHNPKTSAPVQQTIDAEMPADLPDTSMTLSGLLPEDAAVSVETMEAPQASDEGTVLLSVDITVDDGYEPDAPIRVTVSDPSFAEATSAGKEILVVHTAEDGTLESVEIVSVSGDTVVFMAEHFSQFTFLESAVEMLQSWTEDLFGIALYGFNLISPSYTEIESVPSLEEGLELVRAYQISCGSGISALLGKLNKLYFSLTHGGIEQNERESVAVYGIRDGELSGVLAENPDAETRIELGDAEGFVIVRDTGYRHKNIEQGGVVLNGMMPKTAEAVVTDVTEAYAQSAAQTAAENDESAAESAESAAENVEGAAENGDTPEAGEETAGESAVETPQEKVLAAYEITLRDGEAEYQPDAAHPIRVEIACDGADASAALELRHIRDDGTTEEIKDFTVENGKVCFDAPGFSVYVVVDHENETVVSPRVMFHFIADNAVQHGADSSAYYEGTPYSFRNKSGSSNPAQNTQTTQILGNGESLELIVDPGNHVDGNFYGWYVVDPKVISGTTDAYGIGTATPQKLYYTWPAMPGSITFDSPITITEHDVAVGSTVNWSLNGVSGSGAVDSDGNVHVFLAPVYEKYHFVNFMLYARNTSLSGANSLMTRKLIALGSAQTVDVKISDIRSTSTDSVHLVFMGWEYNAGTAQNENWVRIPTVDYTGAELNAASGGVHLQLDASSIESEGDINLYPYFVEARWVDFFVGRSGSGASYVASRFLRSWSDPPAPGMTDTHNETVFENLTSSTTTRQGYVFDGWYAFAVIDQNTGEITNLTTPADITVSYVDVNNKFATYTVTVNTKAIKVANADGSIVTDAEYCGKWSIKDNAGTYSLVKDGSGTKDLFDTTGGKLRFFDPLDRLTLYAKWAPGDSRITIVYWTENAYDKNYVVDPVVKNNYTASAVKTMTTADWPSVISNAVITRTDLAGYTVNSVSVTDTAYLDDVGGVPAGEEIFYELNTTLSDASQTVSGDGSTIYNLYYSRMEFKLVFHIGRDGYVKAAGRQSSDANWDGNWIQFMYKDSKVSSDPPAGLGYPATGSSYRGYFSMSYNGATYDSNYVTTNENVMGDYVPAAGENVYVITAKYGAYIGEQWPTPTNPNFTFTIPNNSSKTMYTWAAYYGSRYCKIANDRPTWGGQQGSNPDLNGVYEYMSAELCSNRDGTALINSNRVHHIVAYFGDLSNQDRFKQYHILYEAVDGTYDPGSVTVVPGTDYTSYNPTTWSTNIAHATASVIENRSFYEVSNTMVISNVDPQFQMGWEFDGYEYFYSCYTDNGYDNDIYFFYTPKQYTLTFMFENVADRHTGTYYYTQSLADAKNYAGYADPSKEGYNFLGWYTNEAGQGEPFDFAGERMPSRSVVLYPILEPIQYMVKIDPNGGVIDHINYNQTADDPYGIVANTYHVDGTGHDINQATYFNAYYRTPISEYTVAREYIELTQKELDPADVDNYYTGTKYYYVNAQFSDARDGDWGLAPDLRNAVYMDEQQLRYYYDYYVAVSNANIGYYTGVSVQPSFNAFAAAYTSYPDHPYRPVSTEEYSFMGWYQVFDDGSLASMPYNFNDPVTGPLTLRALWRLDGGIYIHYNPYYFVDDGAGNVTGVLGQVQQWNDPADPTSQLYADQSPSHILNAPTDYNPDYVFRGWYVVRPTGDTIRYQGADYPVWEAIQKDANGDPIYYQPGEVFTVDSALVSETSSGVGKIINMHAYYEPAAITTRRPEVTNLILDANEACGGYVNNTDSSLLPTLSGPGSEHINTADHTDAQGRPTQILFGDIQSNLSLHLYRYASTETFNNVTGTNFFSQENGYLLIGFDEGNDPTVAYEAGVHDGGMRTGSPYVPTYSADSVAAVTRNEISKTLYAVWEPMVYVTFVNTTDEDITITLTGTTAETVRIVNTVTGKFERQKAGQTLTVPAKSGNINGSVKVVFPRAAAGTDEFTATATNDHLRKRMSVSAAFRGSDYANTHPVSDPSTCIDVKYGSQVIYSGLLQTDPDGIVVTYEEEDDLQVLFDVNGGTWTDTSGKYEYLTGDEYSIDKEEIVNNAYRPSDPTRSTKVFIGWTTNADIAAQTDFSSTAAVTWGSTNISPDSGGNVLDKVRSEYLWDFTQPPPYDQTLYAVWSDSVTVIFDNKYTSNGSKLHTWNGPAPQSQAQYVFYTINPGEYSYTLAKGDRVPKPDDPSAHSEQPTWVFIKWLLWNATTDSYRSSKKDTNDSNIVTYAFDFTQRITEDMRLVTSWTESAPQTFTFTVENHVVGGSINDEFDYTIGVTEEWVFGKFTGGGGAREGIPERRWGSLTTTLKNNQRYTVLVTVSSFSKWGGDYGIGIDVIDSDGIVIKSDQVIYCGGNSSKYFASHYKYVLTIAQAPEIGYETTVSTTALSGNVSGTVSSQNLSYTFVSKMYRPGEEKAPFSPLQNSYVSGENNGITILFTNTGTSYVAPTGFTENTAPFGWITLSGLVILAAAFLFRRKKPERFEE